VRRLTAIFVKKYQRKISVVLEADGGHLDSSVRK
jgi:hypothetical protein